jgi:diguanylate cyclase (GGDEF)-like protein
MRVEDKVAAGTRRCPRPAAGPGGVPARFALLAAVGGLMILLYPSGAAAWRPHAPGLAAPGLATLGLAAPGLAALFLAALGTAGLLVRRRPGRGRGLLSSGPSPARAADCLAAAMDVLPQGVLVLDAALRPVASNSRARELFPPIGADRAAGTPLAASPPGAAAVFGEPEVASGGSEPFACRHELPDGRMVRAQWRRLPGLGWAGIFDDITEEQRSATRMAHLVPHDGLTDLLNRAGFAEALERALAQARRGEPFAVLAVTLERFRKASDLSGPAAGEALLREAALRLRRSVREGDQVARLGAEEFAVLRCGAESSANAEALVRRLTEALGVPYQAEGQAFVLGAAVGIAFGDATAPDAESVLRNALLAMDLARGEPARGAWRLFTPELDAAVRSRRELESDLRHALGRGEFELFYQPLVSVAERRVRGFEALLRWRHPARGLVPPDTFIPLAEETGLIVPIGEWVLRAACAEAMRWRAPDGRPPPRVAVNLSAVQFAGPGLVEAVAAALRASGLPGARLELEITESVLLHDDPATLATLHRLRDLGARISMDDFGTGYSSLSYLRRFPFDRIKIDKSFVRGVIDSDEGGAIVRAIAGLGHALGIPTTAEGVETCDQLACLIAAGCTELQGYFFGQPRPASEVPALILAAPALDAA